MKSVDQLRKELVEARIKRDGEKIRQIELELTIRSALGPSLMNEVLDALNAATLSVRDLISSVDPEDVDKKRLSAVVSDALRQIEPSVRSSLFEMARKIVASNRENIGSQMTVAQIRAASLLPIDFWGRVRPQPGRDPGVIGNEETPIEDVLSRASPLLHISGDRSIEGSDGTAIDHVMGEPDIESLVENIHRNNRKNYGSWQQVFQEKLIQVDKMAARIVKDLKEGKSIAEILRGVKAVFGLRGGEVRDKGTRRGSPPQPITGGGGLARRIQNILRHESTRMLGQERDRSFDVITADILVGYILHSVFDDNTDPVHASNDGIRFYRDNRKGSDRPWKDRLIPPYRVNCLCFTQEIWEDPEGDEFFATWEAWPKFRGKRLIRQDDVGGQIWDPRHGGFRTITTPDVGTFIGRTDAPALEPRDVAVYEKWFDKQRPGIKRKIVGDRRMFAALSRSHNANYADFVRTDGSFLSVRGILEESDRSRRVRSDVVRQLIDKSHSDYIKGWRSGGGKWSLSVDDERKYRRRLSLFMDRILKKKSQTA